MPRLKLTDLSVKRVTSKPPAAGRVDYFDKTLPAFGIRVSSTGAASWFCFYRIDGRLVRDIFARHPAKGLVAARQDARDRLDLVDRGRDPRTEEARQKAQEVRQRAETFGKVADTYKAGHLDRKRSGKAAWASLQADLLPSWKDLPIRDVGRGAVMERLDQIERERGPVARNRRLALIRHLLNWALDRELVTANVAARIPLLDEAPRARVLSDSELVEVWRASDLIDAPQGHAVKMLILTLQRRNEVFRAEAAEIDRADRLWKIEGRRMKAAKPHIVPITDPMLAVLDSLPKFDPPREHVFASPHRKASTPFGDHGGLKTELDRHILETRQKQVPAAKPMAPWTLHDLRRTGRTGLSRLRVPSHIAERIIAHVPGGIQAVYDVFEYIDEKREALDAWSAYVMSLINPAPVASIEQARHMRARKAGPK